MKVEVQDNADIECGKEEPTIRLSRQEVEENSGDGMGMKVCVVSIVDGQFRHRQARFWIDVELSKTDKPVLHVATNVGNETRIMKIKGVWK